MSELKFKAYGELEISEALSDASHVIIEENGDVKRFPANSIGKVKTVNGAEPDESGNVAVEIHAPVQPDFSQNDPTAPDYVKNRPFYQDTVFDITWDGNAEGLDAVEGMPIYKVSGTTPEKNDISGSEIVFENDGVQEVLKADDIGYMEGENCIAIGELVVITYAENATMAGIIFPTIGVWFLSFGTHFIRSLKKTITKTLDAKYLPDTVATKSEVEAAQTTADNAQTTADNAQNTADNVNQKTRAFSSVSESKTITVTRSNGTSGDEADAFLSGGTESYYLSYEGDILPTKDTLVGSSYQFKYRSGQTATFSVPEDHIFVSDQGDKAIFVTSVGIIATEAGTYTFSKYRKSARATLNNRGIYLFYDTSSGAYVYSFVFAVITEMAKANFGSDGLSLYSSSGKKFKITVDDSGTLTATEVTA